MTTEQPKPAAETASRTETINIKASLMAERRKMLVAFVVASIILVAMVVYQGLTIGADLLIVGLTGALVIFAVAWTVWSSY